MLFLLFFFLFVVISFTESLKALIDRKVETKDYELKMRSIEQKMLRDIEQVQRKSSTTKKRTYLCNTEGSTSKRFVQ